MDLIFEAPTDKTGADEEVLLIDFTRTALILYSYCTHTVLILYSCYTHHLTQDDDGGLGLGGEEEAVIKRIDDSEKSLYDEGFWTKMKEHITQVRILYSYCTPTVLLLHSYCTRTALVLHCTHTHALLPYCHMLYSYCHLLYSYCHTVICCTHTVLILSYAVLILYSYCTHILRYCRQTIRIISHTLYASSHTAPAGGGRQEVGRTGR
jgi:hypothetical protein